jgi:hypothetical protein
MIVERFDHKRVNTLLFNNPKKPINTKSYRLNDNNTSKLYASDLFVSRDSLPRQMLHLTKQSRKNLKVSLSKNVQEENRLNLIKNFLSKNDKSEDIDWFLNFMHIKSRLEQINKKSNKYKHTELLPPSLKSSAAAFSRNTINSRSGKSANSVRFTQTDNEEEDGREGEGEEDYKTPIPSKVLPSLLNNKNKAKSHDELKELTMKRNLSTLTNYSSTTQATNTESFFPILDKIQSYTSFVSYKNDRNTNEDLLKSKLTFSNPTLQNNSSSKSDILKSGLYNLTSQTYDYQQDEESNEFNNGNIIAKSKSVRRPLQRAVTYADILFKLKSLHSRVKYCNEQNVINFNFDDRNTRYGGKLPQRKIYRQLRILSKFEDHYSGVEKSNSNVLPVSRINNNNNNTKKHV